MLGNIEVRLDSYRLSDYLSSLESICKRMDEEIEQMKKAYDRAEWNDMVSEKARLELNEYIDAYNRNMSVLRGVIDAVTKMSYEIEDYLNSAV